MRTDRKSGFSVAEAVIALTVIVLVSAAALTIVLSSISAKVTAMDKAQAQNFAANAWECFKVSETTAEFAENMRFAEGAELIVTGGVCTYTSETHQFVAEMVLNYAAERPVLEMSVTYRGKTLITFSYTKGGGE